METLIVILVVTAIAETIMNSRWMPFYFLKGIPLFKKSVSFAEPPYLSPDNLTTQFSQGIVTPILFYPLGKDLIAFRESLLSFRLFHYTPVMHGLIRVDHEQRQTVVTGYANWFALLFAITFPAGFISNSPEKSESGFIFLFLLILFGTLYVIQYVRFTKIIEAIKEASSKPSGLEPTAQPESILNAPINNKLLVVIVAIILIVWLIPMLIAAFDRDLFLKLTSLF